MQKEKIDYKAERKKGIDEARERNDPYTVPNYEYSFAIKTLDADAAKKISKFLKKMQKEVYEEFTYKEETSVCVLSDRVMSHGRRDINDIRKILKD